jgi:two-component system LytT family response regulator
MTAIRVLLVDDEPLARAGLRAILTAAHDVTVVGEAATAALALTSARTLGPDLVFLDVGLPDGDGFEVARRLAAERRPELVFVTAHADQALRAFEARALDYVTKPLRRARVLEALARARERLAGRIGGGAAVSTDGGARLLSLRADGRVHLVPQDAIDWVEADDDHVVVHAGASCWRARETLQEIARRLDPAAFLRIHRSAVVRLDRVRELQPWFHGDYVVVLQSGAKLRLTRSYRAQAAAALRCPL